MANDKLFVHSYNFVRYSAVAKPKRENTAKGDFSGYIDCSMSVKTPLAIPDSEKAENNFRGTEGHNAYPFYTIGGKPVVSGSEIRGMIRNIYEIITDSCFSVINVNTLSSRHITPNTAVRKTGILSYDAEKGEWILTDAQRIAAYTNTTKQILLKQYAGKDYVVRNWALSDQLSTNMENLKKRVDAEIRVASDYDDLLDRLERPTRKPDGKSNDDEIFEKNIGEDPDDEIYGFIFKKKINNNTKLTDENWLKQLQMNSVNAKKKWGPQYSFTELEKFFTMTGNAKQAYYDKNFSDTVINYSLFVPVAVINTDARMMEKAVADFNTVLDFSEIYAEGNKATLQQIASVRPNKSTRIPVFYRKEGSRIILLPSHFSREVYDKTVETILGERKKCSDKTKLCPGCRLFGMIDKNGEGYGSRVRFGDATAVGEYSIDNKYTTLKILASPKTTGWEFYADKEYNKSGVVLKGRKMYFHNPLAEKDNSVFSHSERTKVNASVKLMRKGTFNFRVYFDNITEAELKNLVLSLNLGDNDPAGNLMHKLGHGKPLGLGSVKIVVDKVMYRAVVNSDYSITDVTRDFVETCNPLSKITGNPAVTDLLRICDYHFCDGFNVSYPVVEAKPGFTPKANSNDLASHRYFAWMRNATGFSKSRQQNECNALPVIGETALATAMPIVIADKNTIESKNTAVSSSATQSQGRYNGNNQQNNRNNNSGKQSNNNNQGKTKAGGQGDQQPKVEAICSKCGRKFYAPKHVAESSKPTCYDCYQKSRKN